MYIATTLNSRLNYNACLSNKRTIRENSIEEKCYKKAQVELAGGKCNVKLCLTRNKPTTH